VRVARNRGPGAMLEQVATDFGWSRKRGPAPGRGPPVAGESSGKRIRPLVMEPAAFEFPVTVTRRVLKLTRQPCHRRLGHPVTDAALEEAQRASAWCSSEADFHKIKTVRTNAMPCHERGGGVPPRCGTVDHPLPPAPGLASPIEIR
jgi:hypothetical protein